MGLGSVFYVDAARFVFYAIIKSVAIEQRLEQGCYHVKAKSIANYKAISGAQKTA